MSSIHDFAGSAQIARQARRVIFTPPGARQREGCIINAILGPGSQDIRQSRSGPAPGGPARRPVPKDSTPRNAGSVSLSPWIADRSRLSWMVSGGVWSFQSIESHPRVSEAWGAIPGQRPWYCHSSNRPGAIAGPGAAGSPPPPVHGSPYPAILRASIARAVGSTQEWVSAIQDHPLMAVSCPKAESFDFCGCVPLTADQELGRQGLIFLMRRRLVPGQDRQRGGPKRLRVI